MTWYTIVLLVYLFVCVIVFIFSAMLAAHSHGQAGLKDVLLVTFLWPYVLLRIIIGLIMGRGY